MRTIIKRIVAHVIYELLDHALELADTINVL